MCTSIFVSDTARLFGRNLDVEIGYGTSVIITPRDYTLSFRRSEKLTHHNAIIGSGIILRGYPLYFDAANEYGLAIAGLSFVGNAKYFTPSPNKLNVASFELIPYILATAKNTDEARDELARINVTDVPFSRDMPPSDLHWMIADRHSCIVIEQTNGGLKVYDNPVGVLTNNPPFPFHLYNLDGHLNLTSDEPKNRFSDKIKLDRYSRGMGAIGLPGDLSSASRFVRAAFTKLNATPGKDTEHSISQAFHILASVEQTDGCAKVGDKYEYTEYSSVINLDTLTYYYRTYANSAISAVRLFSEDLDSSALISYPTSSSENITYKN